MFDTLGGIPSHPLFVHAAVTLVPLFAILTVLYCLVVRWRWQLRMPVVVTGILGSIGAFIAVGAGEELEARMKRQGATGVDWKLVEQHGDAGSLLRIVMVLLTLATVAAVFTVLRPHRDRDGDRDPRPYGRKQPLRLAVASLLVLGSLFTGYQAFVAGHSGARLTWGDTVQDGK